MEQPTFEYRARDNRLVRTRRTLLLILISLMLPLLSGCQITYVIKSAYNQFSLLNSRVRIEQALTDPRLTDEEKRKLRLAMEAIEFAEKNLGLNRTENYRTYVHLDRPYVTYVVNAAYRNELKAYEWWFPIVGSVPYKGFFSPEEAKEEASKLAAKGYDSHVRGVSAYSTLGWFSDPILSSMLRYQDHELVETIIHETVHATIYIKGHADFNERLAVFIGRKGALEFYKSKEGPNGTTIHLIEDEYKDERLFADFMSKELESLESWYVQMKETQIPDEVRDERLKEIIARFKSQVRPQLKLPERYSGFENSNLNNAILLNYRLYFENLDDFEAAFSRLGGDFKKMLEFSKSLEKAKDPKLELEKAAHGELSVGAYKLKSNFFD